MMKTIVATQVHFAFFTAAIICFVVPGVMAQGSWLKKGVTKKVSEFDGRRKKLSSEDKFDKRGKVTVRRIRPQCFSDWNTDPTALPYLFYQLRLRTGDESTWYADNSGLSLLDDEIFDYPILYFTSHYAFFFSDEEVENLKKYLKRGGTLWMDDCVGSGPFMESVPQNVQRIAPGAEMKLVTRTNEFSDLYTIVYQFSKLPDLFKEQFNRPFQAAMVRGRPAILFCPNDYGCRWEISTPPTALNPLGEGAHGMAGETQREAVYQFGINWLLYTLTN
ncbi:MAG: DUF4159 domain-containing protein [Lentisphaeria bacterium]|nr:DUF4159 domain-containing protein [Lentisphaeria bacterium]